MRFSFRVFVWIFGLSNALVWFGILYAVARVFHNGFANGPGLARDHALWLLCLTPLVSGVLAVQGAVVNLRAQYLDGRFDPPAGGRRAAAAELANPWLVAARTGAALWLIALPCLYAVGRLGLPPTVSAPALGLVLGSFGALAILAVTFSVGVREFQAFIDRMQRPPVAQRRLAAYLAWQLALPWGVINLALNGVFGWILYHRHLGQAVPAVGLAELRIDLAVMTAMIFLLIGLAAMPEAECDTALRVVAAPDRPAAMPRLGTRLLLAVGLALGVWLGAALVGAAGRVDQVTVSTAIGVRALLGGAVAAASAVLFARWSLARSRTKHAGLLAALPLAVGGPAGPSAVTPAAGS